MRQVPANTSYLVIGDGRLARHVRHYLDLLNLSQKTWRRSDGPVLLKELAESSSHALMAISDGAIDSFYLENPALKNLSCVHFSGSLLSPYMPSAHPLMTFGRDLYELKTYREIPFVLERGRGSFADLLPGLPNPSHAIDAEKKTLYHALCVLSGNFTVMLWEKAFSSFARELGLDKQVLLPYLDRTARNLAASEAGSSVLTGPLARHDHATIEKHLRTLGSDPFAEVYRAFVSAHEPGHEFGHHLGHEPGHHLGHQPAPCFEGEKK
jgi:hypothetical protein